MLGITLVVQLEWRAWPFELLTNFPVQFLVGSALVALAAALTRARIAFVLVAIALVVNATIVGRTMARSSQPTDPRAGSVTFGHLNAQTRPIDVPALGAYLHELRPAAFVVLDPVQSDVPGLTHAAPGYRVAMTGSHNGGRPEFVRTVVLSRVPVTDPQHPADPRFGRSAVEFTLTGASPIDIVAFGTDSPTTPARARERDRALDAAARWSRAHGARRIVMGDFNATPWSPSFGRLLQHGQLRDSLDGFGIQPSWPESNVLIRIPIDHALLGPALGARDRGTGPSFGSQHRSLHVTVATAR